MAAIKFVRGDSVKVTDEQFKAALLAEGWSVEGEKPATDDLEALREEAKALGLNVHHKTGADKLAAMIEEAKAAQDGDSA